MHWLIAEQSVDCHEYHKRQGRMEKWLDPARSSGRSVFEVGVRVCSVAVVNPIPGSYLERQSHPPYAVPRVAFP